MRQIEVTEAQVGDIIAGPVINDEGRVLLPKGAKLSPAVLSRLAGWGVQTIQVEGDDVETVTDEPGASDAAADLDQRFSAWEEDELMMAIKQVARRHLTAKA